MLMVIGTILTPSLTTPSAGKLSDFFPNDGMCGLSTEERIEVLRNVQNAATAANDGGASVPDGGGSVPDGGGSVPDGGGSVPDVIDGGVLVPQCGPGLWLQIANFDVTGGSNACPPPWDFTATPDGCRQMNAAAGCAVATFPTGIEYGTACGRIIADATGDPESFNAGDADTETDGISLIDGITITHSTPIQHIWTFSASQGTAVGPEFTCPCNTVAPSNTGAVNFAGDDYFCDTTNGGANLLWDNNCPASPAGISQCCQFNEPPFFTTTLPTRTSANVDVHLCRDQVRPNEDILVQIIELYVQ